MIRAALAMPLAAALLAGQFRASVDVVRLDALVLQNGRPVAGLGAADFAVTDNGAPQVIEVRPVERLPIDVVVALDTSDSVRGPRLDRLREAALALIAQLTPADRATLATFNHMVTLGPRDTAPGPLSTLVKGITARGETALVDAVAAALAWSWGRERPMLVLVFSDGRDTTSWTRVDQALDLARASEAVVDVVVAGELLPTSTARIGPNDLLEPPTPDERFLRELATATGGRVRNGDAGAGLAGAFRDSLAQFRARYEITFTATGKEPGWHAVDVRVKGRRGATVHVRRGYQR
jgi:VWFA-related protein